MASQPVNLYHYQGLASLAAQKHRIRDDSYEFDDEEEIRSDSEDSDDKEGSLTRNGLCYLARRNPGPRRCKSLHSQDAGEKRSHPRSRLSTDNVPRPKLIEKHAQASGSIHRATQLTPIAELEENKRDEEVQRNWLKSLSARLEQRNVNAPTTTCISRSKPTEPMSLRRFMRSKRRRVGLSGPSPGPRVTWTSASGQHVRACASINTSAARKDSFLCSGVISNHNKSSHIDPCEVQSPRSHNCTNLNVRETAQHSLASASADAQISFYSYRKRAYSTASSSSTESGPIPSAIRSTEDLGKHNEMVAAMTPNKSNARSVREKWMRIVRKVLQRSASGSGRTKVFSAPTLCHRESVQETVTEKFPAKDHFRPHPRKMSSTLCTPNMDPRGRRGDKKTWNAVFHETRMHGSGGSFETLEDVNCAVKECQHHKCKECGSRLVKYSSSDRIDTMRTAIEANELTSGNQGQLSPTLADDREWDVEAAVQHRMVQMAFTVPKFELRVLNPDTDGSSITSITEESSGNAQAVLSDDFDPSSVGMNVD